MKTLFCFYDMAVSPCSYDFFTFLYSAENCRIRRGLDCIDLSIVKGPSHNFRKDNIRTHEQNENFFLNVIIPGISLVPSCVTHRWIDRNEINNKFLEPLEVFPRGYSAQNPTADYVGHDTVASKLRQDTPGCFRAPNYAKNLASEFISTKLNNLPFICVTAREIERDNKNDTRTLDVDIWNEAIEQINRLGIHTVLIRDTISAFSNQSLLQNVTEFPVGSIHLPLRQALYEKSVINFSKNNGPGMLQLFTKNHNVYFHECDEEVTALSSKWFSANYGMVKGSQLPMTRKCNRYFWGPESVADIMSFVSDAKKASLDTSTNNSFSCSENLSRTVEVALRHLCRCINHSTLNEDLRLYHYIEGINKKLKLSNTSILELLEQQTTNGLDRTKLEKFKEQIQIP